ncbi:MAG: LysM peptidoglycan-binding domain-containing protein [Anaerolineales bacterium]|nr:LysM peptidoglycan-binding domain-containing protein [Anaerolineales bacterium]
MFSSNFLTRILSLLALTLAVICIPQAAFAGGVCGGAYIVEAGETFSSIAARCGTSVANIVSANPKVKEPLKAGQSITVPGANYNSAVTNPNASVDNSTNYGPVNYSAVYTVQVGDTFSSVAQRYGVSVNALWAANPNIWDINYLFVGQTLNVPSGTPAPALTATPGGVVTPLPTEPEHLSWGTVPFNAPKGVVTLANKANGQVYVSLQGTTQDGTRVINEYSVDGTMLVKVPSGSYRYVASVGGIRFVGYFQLGKGGEAKITFYEKKVVVE